MTTAIGAAYPSIGRTDGIGFAPEFEYVCFALLMKKDGAERTITLSRRKNGFC